MSENIFVSMSAAVNGGPTQMISQSLTVDAYDKIDVKVPDGATDMKVELQPGGAGQVHFLLIDCDHYSDKLSYKANASTDSYQLDGPHALIGLGGVSMLDPAPSILSFSNSSGGDLQVKILIGRKAT